MIYVLKPFKNKCTRECTIFWKTCYTTIGVSYYYCFISIPLFFSTCLVSVKMLNPSSRPCFHSCVVTRWFNHCKSRIPRLSKTRIPLAIFPTIPFLYQNSRNPALFAKRIGDAHKRLHVLYVLYV